MSLSCARHSRLTLCLCSFRFSSFFHKNFGFSTTVKTARAPTQERSTGLISRGRFPMGFQGETNSKLSPNNFFEVPPAVFFLGLPLCRCVCLSSCRGLGSPGSLSPRCPTHPLRCLLLLVPHCFWGVFSLWAKVSPWLLPPSPCLVSIDKEAQTPRILVEPHLIDAEFCKAWMPSSVVLVIQLSL